MVKVSRSNGLVFHSKTLVVTMGVWREKWCWFWRSWNNHKRNRAINF